MKDYIRSFDSAEQILQWRRLKSGIRCGQMFGICIAQERLQQLELVIQHRFVIWDPVEMGL